MKPVIITTLALSLLTLAAGAQATDPVVVVQETRTPGGTKQRPIVQHVVLLKNVSPAPVHRLRVTVEFYDFFGKILWARTASPMPASLGPGETATLSLSAPLLESMSRTRYRFEYSGGGASPRARSR